jgi:hypothetical protein
LEAWFIYPEHFDGIVKFSDIIEVKPLPKKLIPITNENQDFFLDVDELKKIELALNEKFHETDPLLIKITNHLNQITN